MVLHPRLSQPELRSSPRRRPEWLEDPRIVGLLGLVAAALFASQCLSLGHVAIDDAYFTFSFARNLALGNGPIYSHGVRVEGYSTFLWMVLLAPGLVLTRGTAPLDVARVVAIPFVALLGWAQFALARHLGASRVVAAAGVVLLAFHTDVAVAYLTGLETVPYVAMLATGVAALLATLRERTSRWRRWVPFLGLAIGLARIDGFLAFAFLLGAGLVRDLVQRHQRPWRTFAVEAALPVALYGAWFAWRWRYYGLPLPSTYYAKALIPQLLPERGLAYVTAEIIQSWLWSGFVALAVLSVRRRLAAMFVGALVAGHLSYVVRVGGDWMPFGRFVLPVAPLLLASFVAGAEQLAALTSNRWRPLRWLAPLAPLALATVVAAHLDHRFWNSPFEREKVAAVAVQTNNVRGYLHAAEFLREVIPPGGRLVTDYGGVFSCYTEGAIIEMWGLANATIATRGNTEHVNPIYGRTCPSCYPDLHPEYFHVFAPLVRQEPAFTSAAAVIANVWQTDTIGRYIDIPSTFTVGRVIRPATGEALYFLQKRTLVREPSPRRTGQGFVIEYPFEGTKAWN